MKKRIFLIILCFAAAFACTFGLIACNKKVEFKVNFVVDGAVYATINTNGEEIIKMPKDPEKEGYVFDGWYWDKDSWQKPFTANSLLDSPLSSSMSVYAKWIEEDVTKKSFTVTFNAMGGSAVNAATVPYGSFIQEPAEPTRTGYYFVGWFSDVDLTTKWNFTADVVTKNITLYAKWIDESSMTACDILAAEGFEVDGNTLSIKVPNAQEHFALSGAITVSPYATWTVSSDISGNTVVSSATVSLNVGDNTYYVNITSGNGSNKKQYTVNIRRREIYTVTYQLNNGQANVDVQVEEDKTLENKVFSKTGYTFTEWQYNNSAWNFETGISGNMTLVAVWDANEYTVTFDSNYGSAVENKIVVFDDEFTFDVSERKGYTFNGWKTEQGVLLTDEEGNGLVAWTIADDTTLYADWILSGNIIAYHNIDGATHNNPEVYTVEDGIITLTAAQKTGYTFLGWYDKVEDGTKVTQIDATEAIDVELWAKWEATEYTATFQTENGVVDTVKFTIEDIELDEPAVPTKDGYTGAWEAYEIVAEDLTINAVYTVIEYTITYENTKGAPNSNETTYTIESDTITLVEISADGYRFDGWYDGNDRVKEIIAGSLGYKTLTAKWTVIEYTITYENTKGTPNSNETTYTIESDTITLVEISADGYRFDGWYDGNDRVEEIIAGSLGHKTLTAKWTVIEYAITYENTQGAENGNETQYTIESETIYLKDLLREGYTFEGWYENGEKVIEITHGTFGHRTLTAQWHINQYTIHFDSNGGSDVSAITQDYASEVSAPQAPVRERYYFLGWYLSENASEKYEFTTMPSEDITLYARWEDYVLTFSYDQTKTAVSALKELTAETFNAVCTDNGGNPIEITVSYTGTFEAGWTIAVRLSASANGVNVQGVIANVKVYGAPTLTVTKPDKDYINPDEFIGAAWGASGTDSFGNATTINVFVDGVNRAGNIETIVIQSVDPAGNMVEQRIDNVKIYDYPTIEYNEGKDSISINDVLNDELFATSAQDSFGENLEVSVLLLSGTVKAGNTVTLRLSATDSKGNVRNIDISVKVYGAPTINNATTTDFKVQDEITVDALGLTATDTFSEPLEITLIIKSGTQKSGATMVYTASVTDNAGNIITRDISVKIYGTPKITYDRTAIKATEDPQSIYVFHTASFNLNGASGTAPASQTITDTKGLTYPAIPTRSGYVFAGWYTTSSCTGTPFDFAAEVASDVTLYAKWISYSGGGIINYNGSKTVSVISKSSSARTQDYYAFVPLVSGQITIYSTGSLDTYGYLYNSSKSELKTDDDGGDGSNFKITYNVTAGTLYYIRPTGYSSSGSTTVYVSGAMPIDGGLSAARENSLLAKAVDSFGQTLDLNIELKSGAFVGGNTVIYTLTATDKLGNVCVVDVPVRIYDENEIVIVYNSTLKDFIKLTSRGEEFFASAMGSFGEACEISIEVADGYTLRGGNTISLYIVATDRAGNVKKSDLITGIKVYDTPTISIVDEFKERCIEESDNIESLFGAFDSFGNKLSKQVTADSAIIAGTYVNITVTTTDIAGNTIEETFKFAVLSQLLPYVELYVDGELWDEFFLESFTNYTLSSPEELNKYVFTWQDKNGTEFTNYNGKGIRALEKYNKLYVGPLYTKIYTAAELQAISGSGKYMLMDNIDFGGETIRSLGSFSGIFDGNGHTISNFRISSSGLFSFNSGTIKNLGVENGDISGDACAGGLVGTNTGTISNCYTTGRISASTKISTEGTGKKAYAYAGGLVGYNDGGTISNCYAIGSVSANSSSSYGYQYVYAYAGGLVGYNDGGTISSCFATGWRVEAYASAALASSYDYAYAGGLVGYGSGINCYRHGSQNVTASGYNGSYTNYSGTSTYNLQSTSFFTGSLKWSTDVWYFVDGQYPKLRYQVQD